MKWILPAPSLQKNIIEALFESRGISDRQKFLNPQIQDLYNPFLMHGITDFVSLIDEFRKKRTNIFIHGDFDVDGITATAILWRFLRNELGMNVTPFIPNRFTDGYGLTDESVEQIINLGGEVIISVDCGIKDIDIINKYRDRIKFIITDHHTLIKSDSIDEYPESKVEGDYLISKYALCTVHPKLDQNYPFPEISGSMVAFKLCLALWEKFSLESDIQKYTLYAGLGTVCDVMPLVDENRIIVKLALDEVKKNKTPGIQAILDISNTKSEEVKAYHFGFVIGPRLNASGRLDSAMKSLRLLCTDSLLNARTLATQLNDLNIQRQELTQNLLLEAEEFIRNQKGKKIFYAYGEDWPEGIIGLIAGRLTEKYNRPVLVASINEKIVKGSARSIDGFNIAKNLGYFREYLDRFGGHEKAAGFSLQKDNLEVFFEKFQQNSQEIISETMLEPRINVDLNLDLSITSMEDILSISSFEPFGYGNPRPTFLVEKSTILDVQNFGKENQHTKLILKAQNTLFEGIVFGSKENINRENFNKSKLIDIVGKVDITSFRNVSKINFLIDDLKVSDLNHIA